MIVVVDSVSGKVSAGPEIHARGFAEDDSLRRRQTADHRRARRQIAEGNTDSYQLRRRCAASSAAGSATPTAAGR